MHNSLHDAGLSCKHSKMDVQETQGSKPKIAATVGLNSHIHQRLATFMPRSGKADSSEAYLGLDE